MSAVGKYSPLALVGSVSFPYHRQHGCIISNQIYSTQESLVLLLRGLLPLSARWASQLTLCMQQIGFTETLVKEVFSAMVLASKILYCQAAEHFPAVSLSASPSAFISLLSFISPSFASSSHSSPFPFFPSFDSSSPPPPSHFLSFPSSSSRSFSPPPRQASTRQGYGPVSLTQWEHARVCGSRLTAGGEGSSHANSHWEQR